MLLDAGGVRGMLVVDGDAVMGGRTGNDKRYRSTHGRHGGVSG